MNYETNRRLNLLLNIGFILVTGFTLYYLVVGIFGYSRLSINVSNGYTVNINGKTYKNGQVKLRSGDYTIKLNSSTASLAGQNLHLKPFEQKTISDSAFKQRTSDEIVNSVIGSYSGYGPAWLQKDQYFQNNTWLVGILEPGSAQPVALHYQNGAWSMIFFSHQGYLHDPSLLPGDVGKYLKQLILGMSNG